MLLLLIFHFYPIFLLFFSCPGTAGPRFAVQGYLSSRQQGNAASLDAQGTMIFPLMCFFGMIPMIPGSPGKASQTRNVSWSWKMLEVKPHPGAPWSAEVIPTMGERLWLSHCTVWSGNLLKQPVLAGKIKIWENRGEESQAQHFTKKMVSPSGASLYPRPPLASLAS